MVAGVLTGGVLKAKVYENPVGRYILELTGYDTQKSQFKDQRTGKPQHSLVLDLKIVGTPDGGGDKFVERETAMKLFITLPQDLSEGIGPNTVLGRALAAFNGGPAGEAGFDLPALVERGARVSAELREVKTAKGVWSRPVVNKDEMTLEHAGFREEAAVE